MEGISIVKETDERLELSCGCVIETIGKVFAVSACSEDCEVVSYVLEESEKQGNIVNILRDKDNR